jgi:aminomethyltransferase
VSSDRPRRSPETRTSVHQTALDARHRALGARMIPFAGWEMPVQYRGLVEEHNAVRAAAGLFDLSHMGELFVTGPDAAAALDYAIVTAPSKLVVGRAHYSMICDETGGVLDDLIVYRLGDTRFMVVPNASNAAVVAAALQERLSAFDAELDDASLRTSLVAIQGPRAAEILQPFVDVDLKTIKYYSGTQTTACGVPVILARTGYTGEDGFELVVAWDDAVGVWDTLLETGAPLGLVPAGLGARDTLRLEAGMPLYGNELDRDTIPFEAGLGRLVSFGKSGDFVGRAALERAKDNPRKALVGLKVDGRGIARIGYPVYLPAAAVACGTVTSGTASPTLGYSIAMGYVPASDKGASAFEVGIRDRRVSAQVVPMPFYRRSI